MDKVFIRFQGEQHCLRRALDQDGIVLDILVPRRRDAGAAQRFSERSLKTLRHVPRVVVADKLELWRGEACADAGCRTPKEPPPQQASGELTLIDPAPRTQGAALQVGTANTALPLRTPSCMATPFTTSFDDGEAA
jgi:hypothetical protein